MLREHIQFHIKLGFLTGPLISPLAHAAFQNNAMKLKYVLNQNVSSPVPRKEKEKWQLATSTSDATATSPTLRVS